MIPLSELYTPSGEHETFPLLRGMLPGSVDCDSNTLAWRDNRVISLYFMQDVDDVMIVCDGICLGTFSTTPANEQIIINMHAVHLVDRLCPRMYYPFQYVPLGKDQSGDTVVSRNKRYVLMHNKVCKFVAKWWAPIPTHLHKKELEYCLDRVNDKIAEMLINEKIGMWRRVPKDVILMIVRMIRYD